MAVRSTTVWKGMEATLCLTEFTCWALKWFLSGMYFEYWKYYIKKRLNPGTWRRLLPLSDWLREMLQFKGQGFLGPPLILSLSGLSLMAQDEINAAWPPEGLLTPVCLSPVQGRAVYFWCGPSALWARLGADQFNLDYTQNNLDLASGGHLLPSWMIVDRLMCTAFLLCKELQSSKQSIVNNTSFILSQTLSCYLDDTYFTGRSFAIPHFHKLVLLSLLDYYYDF